MSTEAELRRKIKALDQRVKNLTDMNEVLKRLILSLSKRTDRPNSNEEEETIKRIH